jgi:hypothetical protein
VGTAGVTDWGSDTRRLVESSFDFLQYTRSYNAGGRETHGRKQRFATSISPAKALGSTIDSLGSGPVATKLS